MAASVSVASWRGRQRNCLRARWDDISTGVWNALIHCAWAGTSGSAVILGEARRVDAGEQATGAVDDASY